MWSLHILVSFIQLIWPESPIVYVFKRVTHAWLQVKVLLKKKSVT